MAELYLKSGREKSVLRRHPWIFSGAISKVVGNPELGQPVPVLSHEGEFLTIAAYNPNSNIAGRIWTWNEDEQISASLLELRIENAIRIRRNLAQLISSDSMRLIYAESDGLPGLILDQYNNDTYVVQFSAAAAEYWRQEIIDIIIDKYRPKVLYERSDIDVRELEGLPQINQLIYGKLAETKLIINENGIKFFVDIINGHKTGFYLDQRDNRLFTRSIASEAKILDCFSYSGGFGIYALSGGAKEITLVDSSFKALEYAKENLSLNKLDNKDVNFVEQDIFKYLRLLRDQGNRFDLIILDPPKFAPTSSQIERASRAYKDINLLALKLLNPGGSLLTFSCSGGLSEELFQKIVASAALDAEIDATIIKRLHQAVDHPVALNFPESAYLKGFLIKKNI